MRKVLIPQEQFVTRYTTLSGEVIGLINMNEKPVQCPTCLNQLHVSRSLVDHPGMFILELCNCFDVRSEHASDEIQQEVEEISAKITQLPSSDETEVS